MLPVMWRHKRLPTQNSVILLPRVGSWTWSSYGDARHLLQLCVGCLVWCKDGAGKRIHRVCSVDRIHVSITPYCAFESSSLKISFNFSKQHDKTQKAHIEENVINKSSNGHTNFIFQAAMLKNENSTIWVEGASSRTVLASTYYGLQGQTQQPSGFRKGQQPSQSYEAASMNHPNFYHSLKQQLQLNTKDGFQTQPKQQLQQQLWQNSY